MSPSLLNEISETNEEKFNEKFNIKLLKSGNLFSK